MEKVLLYFALKYKGDFNSIYKALESHEKVDENLRDDLFKTVKCKYTTIISSDYPEILKSINCPPFVLFYYGNLDILKNKRIGVIGTREPTDYGKESTYKFVKELVDLHYVIISGMALGIDSAAHNAAIENKGKTCAVLGSGIDYCYPTSNKMLYETLKRDHLIMSEYPGECIPYRYNFPKRNRIIAGLSEAILVTEAKERSGTSITVGFALEQGKDVFCVPGRFYDFQGCNKMIQQGARLVANVKDLIDEI